MRSTFNLRSLFGSAVLAASALSLGATVALVALWGCCSTPSCNASGSGSACCASTASCASTPGNSQVCCPPSDADTAGVRDATTAFYAALNDMFVGNIAPMEALWSHESDVTQLGPMGGRLVGWDAVGADWRRVADVKLGGKVVAEGILVVAGPCMGYSVTEEVGQNIGADGKPIEVRFRATNIFRKEKGGWKMVHHHTDLSQGLIAETGLVK